MIIATADNEFSVDTLKAQPIIIPLQKHTEDDTITLRELHSGMLIIHIIKKSKRHIPDKAPNISPPLKGDTGIIMQLLGVFIKVVPKMKDPARDSITAKAKID